MEHCKKSFEIDVPFLNHCPILFASAITGRNLEDLYKQAQKVQEQQHRRVTTGQLNKFIEKAMQRVHPPMIGGKRLKVFYLAQVGVNPPRFVLFVNKPELMSDFYKKYLINQFREEYGFSGAPISFFLKGRSVKGERDEAPSPVESQPVSSIVEEDLIFEENEEALAELDSSYFN
jgi:GTP-binding protein